MPVYKYRQVSDMEDRVWRAPGDPGLFQAMRETWELAGRMTQACFPPGVYLHPSLAAAEALRETWERENFESFHARRRESRQTRRRVD